MENDNFNKNKGLDLFKEMEESESENETRDQRKTDFDPNLNVNINTAGVGVGTGGGGGYFGGLEDDGEDADEEDCLLFNKMDYKINHQNFVRTGQKTNLNYIFNNKSKSNTNSNTNANTKVKFNPNHKSAIKMLNINQESPSQSRLFNNRFNNRNRNNPQTHEKRHNFNNKSTDFYCDKSGVDFNNERGVVGPGVGFDLVMQGAYNQRRISNSGGVPVSIESVDEDEEDLNLNLRESKKLGSASGLRMAVGIACVLVVFLVISSVYVNSLATNSNELQSFPLNGKNITLDDYLKGVYSAGGFNASWISDTHLQYFSSNRDVMVLDIANNRTEVLISRAHLDKYYAATGDFPFVISFNEERTFALLATSYRKIYRYSFLAKYDLLKLNGPDNGELYPVTPIPDEHRNIQLVEWSPSGTGFALVYGNNLFYYHINKDNPSNSMTVQITHTGSPQFYNGIADWVYEEEMLGGSKALWFSNDGNKIAFITFDDTNVDLFQFPIYGEPGNLHFQYPTMHALPYPKAGRNNPPVEAFVVDLNPGTFEISSSKLSFGKIEPDHYIATIFWSNDNHVNIQTMNRLQTDGNIFNCDSSKMSTQEITCQSVYQEFVPDGWIETNTPVPSKKVNQKFLYLTGLVQSDNMRWKHILMVDGAQRVQVTGGRYFVDNIVSWDENRNIIYYTGTKNEGSAIGNPRESHLYKTNVPSSSTEGEEKEKISAPTCLTCQIQNLLGEDCLTNTIQMSKDNSYFVHTCGGPNIPEVTIRKISANGESSELVYIWANNTVLRNKLEEVALPKEMYFDIPPEKAGGFTIKAKALVPHDYDESKKYPILVDVYGGPGSQKLNGRFTVDWGTSLVSSRGIIYASFDGRGSGRQSNDQMFTLNKKLGSAEVDDQIYGMKYLMTLLKGIDPTKTAIWGWSYGGYATAMAMGIDTEQVYKCGISVAPVTSWMFYDTIYTERYMKLPTADSNFEGYNISDVSNHIDNFKNKKFYIIHGNADDNVHYQQSMVLSRALEKKDILFFQQSYPDEDHGIGSVRPHLYHSLENFLFKECYEIN